MKQRCSIPYCEFETESDSDIALKFHMSQCHPNYTDGKLGIFYPEPDPLFVVPEKVAAELKAIHALSQIHPVNVLVTGFPGGGKTTLGIQLAALAKRPCVVVDCGTLSEASEWFSTTTLEETEKGIITRTTESAFVRGVETPGTIAILDEANRAENEKVLNVLMPWLDERKMAWVEPLKRNVKVAVGVIFFATLNEGAFFAGTNVVDRAVRDRFREIYLPYPPATVEAEILMHKTKIGTEEAHLLADFAARVRNNPKIDQKISTRQLLTAAENMLATNPPDHMLLGFWEAVGMAIGNYNNPMWREAVLADLHYLLDKKQLADAKGPGTKDGYTNLQEYF